MATDASRIWLLEY